MSTKQHIIENVHFLNDRLAVSIDRTSYAFPLADISRALLHASPQERQNFKISPSGYGIHWENLDEDLSIDGLLGLHHTPHREKQLACVHESQAQYKTLPSP